MLKFANETTKQTLIHFGPSTVHTQTRSTSVEGDSESVSYPGSKGRIYRGEVRSAWLRTPKAMAYSALDE